MQHIPEGFGMHQAVLDGYFEHRSQLRVAFVWLAQGLVYRFVQLVAYGMHVGGNFITLRPVRRSIGRQSAADRIDAKRKQLIKGTLERPYAKCSFGEQVPVKRFQMSDIENN